MKIKIFVCDVDSNNILYFRYAKQFLFQKLYGCLVSQNYTINNFSLSFYPMYILSFTSFWQSSSFLDENMWTHWYF